MDSDSSGSVKDVPVEIILENQFEERSEEIPRDEWSSLEIEAIERNPKRLLHEEGLYDPGTGDICTAFIGQSQSSVLRHSYYHYPAITDPGILDALLEPDAPAEYPDNGQALYLATCKQMKQYPVRSFHRGLLKSEINLQYYGVDTRGVRAMALALHRNRFVTSLDLTENYLSTDACYHLGVMLSHNYTLQELHLSGCRIGPDGFNMLLTNMITNRSLKSLKLRGNDLGDEGMEHLAKAIFEGFNVKIIDLSRNNICGKGVNALVESFETQNGFTQWDLSWNNLFSPGTYNFLNALSSSADNLVKIDLSWNGLAGARVALGIGSLLNIPALEHLDLSNNKLEGEAIQTILKSLMKASKLVTFNLSSNPLTIDDTHFVLKKLKPNKVRVSRMYMDNISVNPAFVTLLNSLLEQKPNLVVTYGYVLHDYNIKGPDPRELVLNRAEYLCKKVKTNKPDIALIVLQLEKENFTTLLEEDFSNEIVKRYKAPLDDDLINAFALAFPGDSRGKAFTINIALLADYVRQKWPDRQLPTPPPSPGIEVSVPALVAKKGSKKK